MVGSSEEEHPEIGRAMIAAGTAVENNDPEALKKALETTYAVITTREEDECTTDSDGHQVPTGKKKESTSQQNVYAIDSTKAMQLLHEAIFQNKTEAVTCLLGYFRDRSSLIQFNSNTTKDTLKKLTTETNGNIAEAVLKKMVDDIRLKQQGVPRQRKPAEESQNQLNCFCDAMKPIQSIGNSNINEYIKNRITNWEDQIKQKRTAEKGAVLTNTTEAVNDYQDHTFKTDGKTPIHWFRKPSEGSKTLFTALKDAKDASAVYTAIEKALNDKTHPIGKKFKKILIDHRLLNHDETISAELTKYAPKKPESNAQESSSPKLN